MYNMRGCIWKVCLGKVTTKRQLAATRHDNDESRFPLSLCVWYYFSMSFLQERERLLCFTLTYQKWGHFQRREAKLVCAGSVSFLAGSFLRVAQPSFDALRPSAQSVLTSVLVFRHSQVFPRMNEWKKAHMSSPTFPVFLFVLCLWCQVLCFFSCCGYVLSFWVSSNGYEMLSNCGFNLQFSDDKR